VPPIVYIIIYIGSAWPVGKQISFIIKNQTVAQLVVHGLCLLFAGTENYHKLYPSILFSFITPLLLVFFFGFVIFVAQGSYCAAANNGDQTGRAVVAITLFAFGRFWILCNFIDNHAPNTPEVIIFKLQDTHL
jgi:hypothetical protein